jgi:hypothetical protein
MIATVKSPIVMGNSVQRANATQSPIVCCEFICLEAVVAQSAAAQDFSFSLETWVGNQSWCKLRGWLKTEFEFQISATVMCEIDTQERSTAPLLIPKRMLRPEIAEKESAAEIHCWTCEHPRVT